MFGCAVTQIEIDQALVGDAHLVRDRLEIVDGVTVQPDGDLLLELRSVGVLLGLGEIVFFAHVAPVSTDEILVLSPFWRR
jgi:hypothetical protein